MKRARQKIRAVAVAILACHSGVAIGQNVQEIVYSYQYDANGNLTQITAPIRWGG